MSDLAETEAVLQDARDRGDTRSIGGAQKALRRAMTDILRTEVARRREGRSAEAMAEAALERRRLPFWARIWRRR